MKRRQALWGIAGLCLAPGAYAQRGAKIPVVGLLDAGERTQWWAAFREQMTKLGYVEGKGVVYEARFARNQLSRLDALAQDLVRMKVGVIVTAATVATQAARRATEQIPIVTATGTDHVSLGFAASLARPGGNITGVASISSDLTAKRLELLREVLPKTSRLAVLWQSDSIGSMAAVRDLEHAAAAAKITLQNIGVRKSDELAAAFSSAGKGHADAIFVIGSPLTVDERSKIAELALRQKIPTMHTSAEFVEIGGLASYGPSYPDLFRRAAFYVDKILKGANPADLPIEQASKLEMVINRRTAKALGVAIPQDVMLRADRVIE